MCVYVQVRNMFEYIYIYIYIHRHKTDACSINEHRVDYIESTRAQNTRRVFFVSGKRSAAGSCNTATRAGVCVHVCLVYVNIYIYIYTKIQISMYPHIRMHIQMSTHM